MKTLLIVAMLALAGCSTLPSTPTPSEKETVFTPGPKPAVLESTCPKPGVFQAVDLSQPVTQRFLDTMKYLQVETVCRYFDHVNETIRKKTITKAEAESIKAAGLKRCVVFQHNNSKLATFKDTARGKADALRSIELAKLISMPTDKTATIYFGVDFDVSVADLVFVKQYFSAAAPLIRAAGFRVGVYGSGRTLQFLKDQGLADDFWLSMSTGFGGTAAFNSSGQWNMKQTLDRDCGGINVDFDYVNPTRKDFGRF